MRVVVASKAKASYDKPLKHDDVVIVPDYFCDEDDWSLYYRLVEESDVEAIKKAFPHLVF